MRILHISPALWLQDRPGLGMPVFYWNTLGYARVGAECSVLLYGSDGASETMEGCPVYRFAVPGRKWGPAWHETFDGIPLLEYALPLAGRLGWRALYTRSVLRAFRRWRAEIRADVVVGHTEWSAPAACRIARALDAPFTLRIYGAHDLGRLRGEPHLYWKNLDLASAWRKPASAIVVTDDGAYEPDIARRLGVDPARVIPRINGVDKQAGSPGRMRARLGLAAGRPLVFSLCRHSPPKRLDLALEVFAPLRSRPGSPALVLPGSGSQTGALRERARTLGLVEGRHVFFPGHLDREQVRELTADGDILLSAFEDANFSNHLWESMAGGACPVVVHHGEGGRFLRHGEHGLLVREEAGSGREALASALRLAISSLLDSPELLDRLRAGARRHAATLPSWEERMAWELELLRSIRAGYDRARVRTAA